ncbi:hypothetical protein LWI28_009392 [Acer negundo]|uniref:Uncharacterized protein n=1 Tax=Acer negundo TaxID=4023 RepID=A0AAD5JCN1_ACENE|nr:hypothetical protein LWI28_009392 [Acer negundo]
MSSVPHVHQCCLITGNVEGRTSSPPLFKDTGEDPGSDSQSDGNRNRAPNRDRFNSAHRLFKESMIRLPSLNPDEKSLRGQLGLGRWQNLMCSVTRRSWPKQSQEPRMRFCSVKLRKARWRLKKGNAAMLEKAGN